ncbi:hypothetical protein DdX_16922 [Ditylenchus destructor]|uniref:Uncharacterized protein n=1 Tax=Ditylenchus destructor TaxID=166010 RepID=A0AAD4QW97_9BILA|nr:hypothetical protein DdX_16922 [Ditylenchus destructor]
MSNSSSTGLEIFAVPLSLCVVAVLYMLAFSHFFSFIYELRKNRIGNRRDMISIPNVCLACAALCLYNGTIAKEIFIGDSSWTWTDAILYSADILSGFAATHFALPCVKQLSKLDDNVFAQIVLRVFPSFFSLVARGCISFTFDKTKYLYVFGMIFVLIDIGSGFTVEKWNARIGSIVNSATIGSIVHLAIAVWDRIANGFQ